MIECKGHTDHPPCAQCRVDAHPASGGEPGEAWIVSLVEDHAAAALARRDAEIEHLRTSLNLGHDALNDAAAAAYERGRREAFEEAAKIVEREVFCPECNTSVALIYQGRADILRARAAEEGSDDTERSP